MATRAIAFCAAQRTALLLRGPAAAPAVPSKHIPAAGRCAPGPRRQQPRVKLHSCGRCSRVSYDRSAESSPRALPPPTAATVRAPPGSGVLAILPNREEHRRVTRVQSPASAEGDRRSSHRHVVRRLPQIVAVLLIGGSVSGSGPLTRTVRAAG